MKNKAENTSSEQVLAAISNSSSITFLAFDSDYVDTLNEIANRIAQEYLEQQKRNETMAEKIYNLILR